MRYYGALRDPTDSRDFVFKAKGKTELPICIDNRDEQTPVRLQREADCVGHAIVSWAESQYWKIHHVRPRLSETAAYMGGKEKDIWPGVDHDGTSLRAALAAWKGRGLSPLDDWPYMGEPKPTAARAAKKYPLIEYRRLYGIYDVMQAIHQYGGVLAAFQAHEGWEHPVNGVIVEDGEPTEGHAVHLCGFHLNIGLLMKNSWGEQWGDEGYAYLPKQMATRDGYDFWLPIIQDGTWLGRMLRRKRLLIMRTRNWSKI